jgi:type I restriction enzyme S subunit
MGIEEIPFSELLCKVIDNRGKTCPTADAGIPLIATNCIRNELLYPTYEKARFVSQDTYSTWFRGHPRPGDILFVNKATPGRVCLVPDPVDFCIAQDMVAVRADPKKIYPKYLFAALRSPIAQERVAQMHVGTLIPHFKKGDFDKLLLPVPSCEVQKFIGDTYFGLSAKIDLNRRMNETLEAMARALFRSWFVDFDPVRAKAEGRDPGLLKPLADLFPDSFEDSELGEIPKGWAVRSIYDIADVIYGAPFASTQFNKEKHGEPLVRIRDLPNEQPSVWTPEMHPKGYKIRPGEIVVSMDGEFRAYLWGGDEAWLNQRVCVFVPKKGHSAAFVRNSITEPLAHVEATETATTVIHPGKSDLDRFLAIVPPQAALTAFNRVCQPWYDRIIAAKRESRTLATLRDTLLPKLISGELRVRDAERLVAEAAL